MIQKINNWLAVKCTIMMSNMWAAYIFCVLSFISLPSAIASHDPFTIVSWISQSFLQLIFLPIIMVGQNLLSKNSEQRASDDHNSIMEILNEVKIIINDENKDKDDLSSIKNEIAELRKIIVDMR